MSTLRLKRNQTEVTYSFTERPSKVQKGALNTKLKLSMSNSKRSPYTFHLSLLNKPPAIESKPKLPPFKGREVVFVDPLDETEEYWWPAMVVPFCELDSTMVSTPLQPGECVVKYFEDNKYSVVMYKDLKLFKPDTEPFIGFEKRNRNFCQRAGVRSALNFIKSQRPTKRFKWRLWGEMETAQGSVVMDHIDDSSTNSSREAKKITAAKPKPNKTEQKKTNGKESVKRDSNSDAKSDKASSTDTSSSLPTPLPRTAFASSTCPVVNSWIDKYISFNLMVSDPDKFKYRCQLLLHKLQKRYRKSQNDLTFIQRDLIQVLPNHVVRKLRTQDRRQKK